MTVILNDSIVSALGFTTAENYLNVEQGKCGLRLFADRYSLPEPFMASAIDDERLAEAFRQTATGRAVRNDAGYTRIEKAAIVSVAEALNGVAVDPADSQTLFILSTTKGNIDLLDGTYYDRNRLCLWSAARHISAFFGNPNQPLVVSNACISGISAMMAAQRALKRYRHVIVTGADVLSRFIISGFQSFKALSQEACRPFDANRTGLNIGEAAATVVMTERPAGEACGDEAIFITAAVRNDANHISGPSRTGEGAYRALCNVLQNIDRQDISFVNAHGTATLYNDEMEAVALSRAGLQDIPVNSLKGYFGHTLGAAGVLESIISLRALRKGAMLATAGFENHGVAHPLRIVTETRLSPAVKPFFLKMLSGFGGCNAAGIFGIQRHSASRIS